MRKNYFVRKTMVTALTILLCVSAVFTGVSAEGFILQYHAYAAEFGTEIRAGDTLELMSGNWSEEYVVLDPLETNSGEDGAFVILKECTEKTIFDSTGLSNDWQGSDAQKWCTDYYNALPVSVRNSIIGVKTSETESGYSFSGINNIDGTGRGTEAAKDKVFFISSKEYADNKDVIGFDQGDKWRLRDYGTDCADVYAYASVVDVNGKIYNYGAEQEFLARPAFNIHLPYDACAVRTNEGAYSKWTVDVNQASHDFSSPGYSVSGNSCTARYTCADCGKTLRKAVNPAVKDIDRGDEITFTENGNIRSYIVLDPEKTNTGEPGMLLVQKDCTETVKMYDDEVSKSNIWEGSPAQKWCTEYYNHLPAGIRDSIIGVKTSEVSGGIEYIGLNNINGSSGSDDKVFFLSYGEVLRYFPEQGERTVCLRNNDGAFNWWLRSPHARINYYSGCIKEDGSMSIADGSNDYAARPAFNIDIPLNAIATEEESGKWKIEIDEDKAAAESVRELISKLPEASDVTVNEKNAIESARYAYDSLSPKQKSLIDNETLGHLTAAEEALESIQKPKMDVSKLKPGDHIYMGKTDAAGYTGIPYWRVLDKETDGTLLLMSEYLWKGDGTDANVKLKFNAGRTASPEQDQANDWQGSAAQNWCKAFYKAVLSGVEGLTVLETTKTDGYFQSPDVVSRQYSEKENILNKDKVFFLSAEEAAHYAPSQDSRIACLPGSEKAESWWLRSPRYGSNICSGCVYSKGSIDKNYVDDQSLARPVFRARLDKDSFAPAEEPPDEIDDADEAKEKAKEKAAKDKAAADAVREMIIALPSSDRIRKEDSPAVEEARAAYNALTDDQKEMIDEDILELLMSAEKALSISTEPDTGEEPLNPDDKTGDPSAMPDYSGQGDPASGGQNKPDALSNTELHRPAAGTQIDGPDGIIRVISPDALTVVLVKAPNRKSVSVPDSVMIDGKSYRVVGIGGKAFTAKKIRKVTVGRNVMLIMKNAFAGSRAKTIVIKTDLLRKSKIKGCLKSSKIKTVSVKVGSKKKNRALLKRYKKIFTKKNAGRKVKLK